MATLDDVERLATALPDVTEGTTFGNQAWFVSGNVFCWVRPFSKADIRHFGDDPVPGGPIIGLRTEDMIERDAIVAAGEPGLFTIEHLANHPGYLVQLEVVEDARLAVGIEDAWLARAPQTLAEQYLRDR